MKYDAGAQAYDSLTGRWSRLYASALLDGVSIEPGFLVLDLATGTGDAALLAGQHVQTAGMVVGVDISVPMLRMADSKSPPSNVRFLGADAMMLPFGDSTFDGVICNFGLMFFPDMNGALSEIRRVLRPRGRVALTVWDTAERAPFVGIMARALGEALPAVRDELLLPFALSSPVGLERLLISAGFHAIEVKLETRVARFGSVADFLEPYEHGGGRLGQAYLQLAPDVRAAVRQNVLTHLTAFTHGDHILMDVNAVLASGAA